MMELEDSRQQLKYISEDLRAIRSAALMADENRKGYGRRCRTPDSFGDRADNAGCRGCHGESR